VSIVYLVALLCEVLGFYAYLGFSILGIGNSLLKLSLPMTGDNTLDMAHGVY
jgi:hypothetical protein